MAGFSKIQIAREDISFDKWHFLAGTYDGKALKIFLDGELKNQREADGGINYASNNSLIVGANCGPGEGPYGSYFKGFIDELRIYNYGLTQAEIMSDMGNCRPTRVAEYLNSPNMPEAFALYPNYPNPFNPITTIEYDLPVSAKVSIVIFNVSGQRVETLVNGFQKKGHYKTSWDASAMSSGIYFYQIRTNGHTSMRKCLLLR